MTDDATYRKMKQERDLALAECERLKKINSDLCRIHNGHLVEAARLELECERLRADAERYRLIRRHPTFMGWDSDFRPDEIDAEVDKLKSIAARAKP